MTAFSFGLLKLELSRKFCPAKFQRWKFGVATEIEKVFTFFRRPSGKAKRCLLSVGRNATFPDVF